MHRLTPTENKYLRITPALYGIEVCPIGKRGSIANEHKVASLVLQGMEIAERFELSSSVRSEGFSD